MNNFEVGDIVWLMRVENKHGEDCSEGYILPMQVKISRVDDVYDFAVVDIRDGKFVTNVDAKNLRKAIAETPKPKRTKQELNTLRNVIHNEVGITKEEIRQMVEDSITHLVDKRVKQLLPDSVAMDRLVDEAVKDRSLYFYDTERKLDDRIIQGVSKIIAGKIKIKVDVK